MIGVYFNESGYYIQGSKIEMAWSCSPAVTETGKPIFAPTHHLCGVLYRALRELCSLQTDEDVIVYSDSRLIEEINGITSPLDDIHARWQETFRRRLLPHIKAHVLFRKKATQYVDKHVNIGHEKLIGTREITMAITQTENRKKAIAQRFKESWFNGNREKE